MSIRISCPHCNRAYQLADTQRGKTIRCKECQGTFKIEDGQDHRPLSNKSISALPAADSEKNASDVDHAPKPQFEEEIRFSRMGLLKSLMWLILWQAVCISFAFGMPILGYLALTRQKITLESIIPLTICVLATIAGVCGIFSSRASLRLFLLSTIPSSSHYLIMSDRLRRYSRRGKVLDEIPFSNVAEVRLVTRRLTDVMGEAADPDVKAKIVHIKLHNPEHKKTIVDHHFLIWSQQVHDADLAVPDDFMDVPIKTVYKKIKKRWQQWQDEGGRTADREPSRPKRRSPQPWYKGPAVIVVGACGVVALGVLAWVLIGARKSREPGAAQIPNPDQQPITKAPGLNQQPPAGAGPNSAPPLPGQAAPEKLAPATLPGLIAYWPLNEAQGAGTLEETRKLRAIRHGGEWVPGIKGSALHFNGTSDFLDLGDDARLNFGRGAPLTLAGWVSTTNDRGAICAFRKSRGFGVISVLVVKGNLHGWIRDDNSGFGGVQLNGGPIKDGKWHHFALTRQTDGTVELFLDGQSQGKNVGKNSGGPITTDLRTLATDRFVVAKGKNAPAYFNGSIDEVCLYDRALTPRDIGILSGKQD